MKELIQVLALAVALALLSCSPGSQPPPLAADLGKSEEYYRNVYGAPKTEKQVPEFAFFIPRLAESIFIYRRDEPIHINRPFVVQDYESGRLKAAVLLSGLERRAIWVKYTLPDAWTQEQVNAALKAYGSDWTIVDQGLAAKLILGQQAPAVYRSNVGSIALKTGNELIVYAPKLYAELKAQVDEAQRRNEEAERQKRAIPKF